MTTYSFDHRTRQHKCWLMIQRCILAGTLLLLSASVNGFVTGIIVSRRFSLKSTEVNFLSNKPSRTHPSCIFQAFSETGNQGNDADITGSRRQKPDIQGVTLKIAFDRNGGVADLSAKKSGRFTCPQSLDMVHRLRRDSDAVLVGRSTVEADDCTLTIRRVEPRSDDEGIPKQPVRVLLDPSRKLKLKDFKFAHDGLPVLIYYNLGGKSDHETATATATATATITTERDPQFQNVVWIGLATAASSAMSSEDAMVLSTRTILHDLKQNHGIHHVMVEGGPTTARQFLKEKLVDRAILVYAPMEFQIPLPSHLTKSNFKAAGLELVKEAKLGVDRVEYWSRQGLPWPETDMVDIDFWP